MKDLIAELEEATEYQQERLIVKALQFAYDQGWITLVVTGMAARWVRHGAYLSAAMVLMPEGWGLYKLSDKDPTLENDSNCSEVRPYRSNNEGWKKGIQYGSGSTLALSLTIATLKAREI